MKRIFFLIVLVASALQINAQRQRGPVGGYNVAKYYAQDTSTFYLGIEPGTKFAYIDYTDFDTTNAYVVIGAAGNDALGFGAISWTVDGASADSVILDNTTLTVDKNALNGTRTSTARAYFWFPDGFPSSYIAIRVIWGDVKEGRLKIYF
jgi:hypothetical protein